MTEKTSNPFKAAPSDPCPCMSGMVFAECCGADDNTPPRGVIIKKHAISDKNCDEMVKYLNKQPRQDALVGVQGGLGGNDNYQKSHGRITQYIKPGKLITKMRKIIETQFSELIKENFGQTLLWYQGPSILFYTSGSWYGTHSDADSFDPKTQSWRRDMDRDFSMLIYLSDGFEGGNVTFNRFGFSYKPRKGDLLLFPSDHRYIHSAEKVTAGKRYAIVAFSSTKESKKVQLMPPDDAVQVG